MPMPLISLYLAGLESHVIVFALNVFRVLEFFGFEYFFEKFFHVFVFFTSLIFFDFDLG
jgi:hypothetical protein